MTYRLIPNYGVATLLEIEEEKKQDIKDKPLTLTFNFQMDLAK